MWGPAISSRGNDHADATSNPSHSPVWFIKDMGDAYRASGRTKPIFDVFDIHPYPPIQDTDPFSKPFQWPQAGAANLDRIKQALWDAFHGTGQPTPAEQSGGRTTQAVNAARFSQPQALPISLDEVGEQTVITGHEAAYTDGPDSITPISEQQQAANHVALMEIAACDPDVQSLFFFPLIDETDVHNGFQSGNLFADLQPKQSYAAVKAKIASAQGSCQGGVTGVPETWQHTTTVIGAKAFFGGTGLVNAPNRGAQQRAWGFSATASEDANYTATLTRVSGPSGGSPTTVDTDDGPDPRVLHAGDQVQDDVAPGRLLPALDHDERGGQRGADGAFRLERLRARRPGTATLAATQGPSAARTGSTTRSPSRSASNTATNGHLTHEQTFARVANRCS